MAAHPWVEWECKEGEIMAHASILDVWNAGANTYSQAMGMLTKEKEFQLDTSAYTAGLKLDTAMYKILQDTQNTNNPQEIQQKFRDTIQKWKNEVAWPGGNNSKYYTDKIDTISQQADATFQKKLYEQTLFRDHQNTLAAYVTSQEETRAAPGISPAGKIELSIDRVNKAYEAGAIDSLQAEEEKKKWARQILTDEVNFNGITSVEDLEKAKADFKPEIYNTLIDPKDVTRALDDSYNQALKRIQQENYTTVQNLQATFSNKSRELVNGEKAAYEQAQHDLAARAAGMSAEDWQQAAFDLETRRANGGFVNQQLRELQGMSAEGKKLIEDLGEKGLGSTLGTVSYFVMPDLNRPAPMPPRSGGSGSGGSSASVSEKALFDEAAYNVIAFFDRQGASNSTGFTPESGKLYDDVIKGLQEKVGSKNSDEAIYRKFNNNLMDILGKETGFLSDGAKVLKDIMTIRESDMGDIAKRTGLSDKDLESDLGHILLNVMSSWPENDTSPEGKERLEKALTDAKTQYVSTLMGAGLFKNSALRDKNKGQESALKNTLNHKDVSKAIYARRENPDLVTKDATTGGVFIPSAVDNTIKATWEYEKGILHSEFGINEKDIAQDEDDIVARVGGKKYRLGGTENGDIFLEEFIPTKGDWKIVAKRGRGDSWVEAEANGKERLQDQVIQGTWGSGTFKSMIPYRIK
jgi:hypothetical protein